MIMYEIWATLFQDWSLWFCMQIFWVNNSNPFLSVIHYLIINMNTRYSFKNWFLTFKCVKQCRPRRYLATLLKASFTNLKSIFNFQFFWNHHACISYLFCSVRRQPLVKNVFILEVLLSPILLWSFSLSTLMTNFDQNQMLQSSNWADLQWTMTDLCTKV